MAGPQYPRSIWLSKWLARWKKSTLASARSRRLIDSVEANATTPGGGWATAVAPGAAGARGVAFADGGAPLAHTAMTKPKTDRRPCLIGGERITFAGNRYSAGRCVGHRGAIVEGWVRPAGIPCGADPSPHPAWGSGSSPRCSWRVQAVVARMPGRRRTPGTPMPISRPVPVPTRRLTWPASPSPRNRERGWRPSNPCRRGALSSPRSMHQRWASRPSP